MISLRFFIVPLNSFKMMLGGNDFHFEVSHTTSNCLWGWKIELFIYSTRKKVFTYFMTRSTHVWNSFSMPLTRSAITKASNTFSLVNFFPMWSPQISLSFGSSYLSAANINCFATLSKSSTCPQQRSAAFLKLSLSYILEYRLNAEERYCYWAFWEKLAIVR